MAQKPLMERRRHFAGMMDNHNLHPYIDKIYQFSTRSEKTKWLPGGVFWRQKIVSESISAFCILEIFLKFLVMRLIFNPIGNSRWLLGGVFGNCIFLVYNPFQAFLTSIFFYTIFFQGVLHIFGVFGYSKQPKWRGWPWWSW